MKKERTMKDIIKDAVDRELAKEPVKTMTPDQLQEIIDERKRNQTLPQRIWWHIDTWFMMRRVRRQMNKEHGKGNW